MSGHDDITSTTPLNVERGDDNQIRIVEEEIRNDILDPNIKDDFRIRMLVTYFFFSIFLLIPQFSLFSSTNKTEQLSIGGNSWWVVLPIFAVLLTLIILSYTLRKYFLTKSSGWLVMTMFVLYSICLAVLFIYGDFYSVDAFITFTGTFTINFLLLIVMHFVKILKDKKWIKLICVIVVSLVIMIFYLIVIQTKIVEFFILLTLSIMFYAYVLIQMTIFFFDCVKLTKLNFKEGKVSGMTCLVIFMAIPVDFLVCCFK